MATMRFKADDLDWAMGELLALFARGNRLGIPPHRLDPDLFHEAWSLLNAQPFPVRKALHATLLRQLTHPPHRGTNTQVRTRYENALTE